MKRISKHALIIFYALISAPVISQAGFFSDMGKQLQEGLTKSTNQDTEPKAPPSQAETTAAALTGAYIERHDYEGALKPDDYQCEQLVEPFSRTQDRINEIFEEALGNASKGILGGLLGGGKTKDAKQEVIKEARLSAKRTNWMTMDMEMQYGKSLHQSFIQQSENYYPRSNNKRVKRKYQQAEALLKQVVTAIDQPHDYTFQVFLLDSLDVAAYAIPGGYIYLTTATLESDHAQLVLAHEIAHVLKRHQTRELQARLIDTVSTINDLKKLLDNDSSDPQALVKTAQLGSGFLNFSKKQEIQADSCAVRLAAAIPEVDIGKQIVGLTDETLKAVEEDKPRSLFSIHPGYEERRQNMEKIAAVLE